MDALEVAPGDVYLRRTPGGRQTLRRVLLVRDGKVVYRTRSNTQRTCKLATFIRWADARRRFSLKEGPLL